MFSPCHGTRHCSICSDYTHTHYIYYLLHLHSNCTLEIVAGKTHNESVMTFLAPFYFTWVPQMNGSRKGMCDSHRVVAELTRWGFPFTWLTTEMLCLCRPESGHTGAIICHHTLCTYSSLSVHIECGVFSSSFTDCGLKEVGLHQMASQRLQGHEGEGNPTTRWSQCAVQARAWSPEALGGETPVTNQQDNLW